MNKFELLKQLMISAGNPEKQKDYMEDQYNIPLDQRIQDIKGMTRNPELYKSLPVTEYEEPASNNIWYAPDELVAGAIAPGVQRGLQVAGPRAFKTLQAMSKAAPTLANEAGTVGRKLTLDELAKIAVEKSLAEEAATDSAGRSSPYLRASATKAMRRFADERRRLGLTDQEQINLYGKYYRELLDKLKKDKE